MDQLNMVSLNVEGLNSLSKGRKQILPAKTREVDIYLIQNACAEQGGET